MAVLHVCLRCGKLHSGRGRCRECRRAARRGRYVVQPQEDGIEQSSSTRIRRIVLVRDGCCLHCGALDDLIVQPFPGLGHSQNPTDYTTLCRGCAERAADKAA